MKLSRFDRMPLACSLALACSSLALSSIPGTVAAATAPGSSAIRLCGAEAKTSELQDFDLYLTDEGLRMLQVPAADLANELAGVAKAGSSDCAQATTPLTISFPGEPESVIDGTLRFWRAGTPQATIDGIVPFGLSDIVLCESYADSTGLGLKFTDTNGDATALAGWASIRYDLALQRVILESTAGAHGPLVQCHVFPYAQAQVPDEAALNAPIFDGTFETGADLVVETLAAEGPDHRVGALDVISGLPFQYRLRVRNAGGGTAAGVHLREFLPTQVTAVNPLVAGGSWTCTLSSGAACPVVEGSGAIDMAGLTLAPKAWVEFAITRTLADPQTAGWNLLAAAAFVDTGSTTGKGELEFQDNAATLLIDAVTNNAPAIACTPDSPTLLEDAAAVPVTCTVTDADGHAFGDLAASGEYSVLLEDIALLPGDVAGTYTFVVEPRLHQNGQATIVLSSTDEHGKTGSHDYVVTVTPVNTPPTFEARHATITVAADGSDPASLFAFPPSCSGGNCEAIVAAQFLGFDAGASDESGQSIKPHGLLFGRVQTCAVEGTGASAGGFFHTYPEFHQTGLFPVADDPTFDLRFVYKQAATGSVYCDFQFEDDGGAISEPVRVTFTMQAPTAP